MSTFARGGRLVTLAALCGVLGLSLWFRLSSLNTLPIHMADESYYGIQAWRLSRGQEFRLHTTSGNLIDPFLLGPQAVLHWFWSPGVWMLRTPVAVSGLIAVLLVFVTADRVWDRRTAVWSGVLLATLPMAISFSRVGCEFGQTPMAGAIAAWFALQGRGRGFLLAVVAAFLVHPTNVFLIPILGPVFLLVSSRRWREDANERRRFWRRIVSASVGLMVVCVVVLIRRPIVQNRLRDALGRVDQLDWSTYSLLFCRRLIGTISPTFDPGKDPWPWALGVAGLLVVGSVILAHRRQWDRLALVAGTILGLGVLHLLGGSRLFENEDRYAAVLLVPLCLATGALSACVGTRPLAMGSPWGVGQLPAVMVGGLLLTCSNVYYFGVLSETVPGESVWTMGSESRDPFDELLDEARAEFEGYPIEAPGEALLVTEHYFVTKPLEYLSAGESSPRIVELITLPELGEILTGGDPLPRNAARLGECLRAGHVVAQGPPTLPILNGWVERTAREFFPGDRLRVWRPKVAASNLVLFRGPYREGGPSRTARGASTRR